MDQFTLAAVPRRYYCLRHYYLRSDYDREQVWARVIALGGHAAIAVDTIDYWIPQQHITFLLLQYPALQRIPESDLL